MNKNEKQLSLINGQLIGIFLFIICLIVSLLITYNEKLNMEQKKPLFSNKDSLDISLINRIIIVFLSIYFVYDAVERKKLNNDDSNLQIIASILVLCSSLIILYIILLNYSKNNYQSYEIEEPY